MLLLVRNLLEWSRSHRRLAAIAILLVLTKTEDRQLDGIWLYVPKPAAP
jgi:hypothetical protein